MINVPFIKASELDSLFVLLKNSNEQEKAAIFNEIGYVYIMWHSIDTARIYTDKAYLLAEKYKNMQELGNAMDNYGRIYRCKSDFKNLIKYKSKAAEYYLKANNLKSYAFCLNDIGSGYHNLGEQEKALEFYFKSYKINVSNNYTKDLAENLNNIGDLYYDAADYAKSIGYYRKIISLPDKKKLANIMPSVYTNIGSVYGVWGKHDSSIIYYQKALDLIENSNNKELKATIYNNIGYEYRLWGKYNQALEFFNLALKMDLEINYEINVASDYNNIGFCYLSLNSLSTAKEYFQQEYDLAVKINQPQYQAMALGNLSQVMQKQKKPEEAMSLIDKEIALIKKYNLDKLTYKAHQLKGNIFFDMKKYRQSIETYRKCLGTVLPTQDQEIIMNCYKLLSDAFKAYGNSDSALRYYKLYTQVKDSAFNKEQHKSLAEYEVKFNVKKKENQIDKLQKNETTLIKKLKQQKSLLVLLLLGIFGILLLTYLLFLKYSRNKKVNRILSEQSKMLAKKLTQLEEQHSTAIPVKYESSLLTEYDIEEIFAKLLNTFNEFDIFLNPNITLPWLAEKLDVLPNHLSQVINQKASQNFNDFINYYRVKEAKSRLLDNKYGNLGRAWDSIQKRHLLMHSKNLSKLILQNSGKNILIL